MNCIFCNIVKGVVPCTRVFEDEDTLAFMDIGPLVKGHVLVIPKDHFDPITAVPETLLCACIRTVQRIAVAQQQVLQADGVNIHQANGSAAGQVVPHVHFHVVPRFQHDGHHWNWKAGSYASDQEREELGRQLFNALSKT